jgi:UDP-galactopyranose mutase
MLNTPWQDIKDQVQYKKMIFTGPIDEYFDYQHGELPYRSLRFHSVSLPVEQHQPVATVNYPNEYTYTRVTEQKQLTGQTGATTTLLYEYPQPHRIGQTIPYYPVPTEANKVQYAKYREEAEKIKDSVLFIGRLASYMYYNMDQAVAAALAQFRKGI